jgi:Flp pilus assembly pilin Flp
MNKEVFPKSALLGSERGATLIEYTIAAAILAIFLLMGVPRAEQAVVKRHDMGAEIWESYHFDPFCEDLSQPGCKF